jgi:hypothetical protein
MTKRLNFFLLALLFASIFFLGCISSKSTEDLSNPESTQAPSQSIVSLFTTTKTKVSPDLIIKNNETSKTLGSHALEQNVTVYHQFDNKTSYELSIGDIIFQQNETSSSESSYIIKFNVTAENSGTVPIDIIFVTQSLEDNSGDGCQSNYRFWCGVLPLGQINPGESKTRTSKITFFSEKGYRNLSSQKFILTGIIDANSDKIGGVNRKTWLIGLKNFT